MNSITVKLTPAWTAIKRGGCVSTIARVPHTETSLGQALNCSLGQTRTTAPHQARKNASRRM